MATATRTRRTPTPVTGNPATTRSPATGKVRGPARKPLAPTTVVGSMGTRTPQPTRPARTPKANVKAAPQAPKAAAPKAAAPSRQLPRDLVRTVTATYAKASAQDQQRVANYLKVVTTGTAACGCRWWPHGKGTLPRPTHVSWAPCGKPAHAAANR